MNKNFTYLKAFVVMALIAIVISLGIYFLELKYSSGLVPFDKNMKSIENFSQLSDFWNLIFGTSVALAGSIVAIFLAISAKSVSQRQLDLALEKEFNQVYQLFSNLAFCGSKIYLLAFNRIEARDDDGYQKKIEDELLNEIEVFANLLREIQNNAPAYSLFTESLKENTEKKVFADFIRKIYDLFTGNGNKEKKAFTIFKEKCESIESELKEKSKNPDSIQTYEEQQDSIQNSNDFLGFSLNIHISLLSHDSENIKNINNLSEKNINEKNKKIKKIKKTLMLIGFLLKKHDVNNYKYITGLPLFIDIMTSIPSNKDLKKTWPTIKNTSNISISKNLEKAFENIKVDENNE